MITKEAMEKVAAADAVDQANAIDRGFEQACFDMGLTEDHARGLAKIAMERLAEFKKLAGEAQLPPHPAAEVADAPNFLTKADGSLRALPNLGKAPAPVEQPRVVDGKRQLGNVRVPAPPLAPQVTVPKPPGPAVAVHGAPQVY